MTNALIVYLDGLEKGLSKCKCEECPTCHGYHHMVSGGKHTTYEGHPEIE